MDFTAKVILDLPLEQGTSKAGNPWRKKSWVLETFGQYPRKVKVDTMGNAVDNVHMEVGKTYTVSVDLESREFNGRWYSDIRAFRAVEQPDGQQPGAPQPNYGTTAQEAAPANPFQDAPGFPPAPEAPATPFTDTSDDLPF